MNKPRPRNKTEQKQIEYKSYVGEMKATNDSQGIIEGYLNAIGNIDDGDDRTMPSAFTRTLKNAYARKFANSYQFLWPYLWNHDPDLIPPGGIFDGDETKQGLFTKVQFNLDMQMGRDLYSSFKMGTLRKQSMGYIAHKVDYVKEAGKMIRNLLEVEILEGSAVVFPMNDLAEVTGVKRNQAGLVVPKYYQGFRSEKDKSMPPEQNQEEPPKQKKDFNSFNQAANASDAETDWYRCIIDPLTQAMIEAFTMGDQPLQDMSDIFDQLKVAGMDWAQEAIESGFSQYLADQQLGAIPNYGWMSNRRPQSSKAGAAFGQASRDMLGQHVANLHDTGDQLHQMADDLAEATGATTYDDASGDDAEHGDNEKRNSRRQGALAHHSHSPSQKGTDLGAEIDSALARLRAFTPKF